MLAKQPEIARRSVITFRKQEVASVEGHANVVSHGVQPRWQTHPGWDRSTDIEPLQGRGRDQYRRRAPAAVESECNGSGYRRNLPGDFEPMPLLRGECSLDLITDATDP